MVGRPVAVANVKEEQLAGSVQGLFSNGMNADRDGTDYRKEAIKISSGQKLNIQLSTGGGWAARIEQIK